MQSAHTTWGTNKPMWLIDSDSIGAMALEDKNNMRQQSSLMTCIDINSVGQWIFLHFGS
jgi:hypothetical protein